MPIVSILFLLSICKSSCLDMLFCIYIRFHDRANPSRRGPVVPCTCSLTKRGFPSVKPFSDFV